MHVHKQTQLQIANKSAMYIYGTETQNHKTVLHVKVTARTSNIIIKDAGFE